MEHTRKEPATRSGAAWSSAQHPAQNLQSDNPNQGRQVQPPHLLGVHQLTQRGVHGLRQRPGVVERELVRLEDPTEQDVRKEEVDEDIDQLGNEKHGGRVGQPIAANKGAEPGD